MITRSNHKSLVHFAEDSPEDTLIAAAKHANESAVRELIRRMNPRLFRVARGIVTNDAVAEEVVQETYLKAFTQLDKFRGEAQFSTWITRIAINTARMQLRRAQPLGEYDTVTEDQQNSDTLLAFPGQEPDRPDAALGRAQMRILLEDAVSHLPTDLRLPFLMREAENMSVRAIAQDLSLNPITVKTRLYRARRRLRTALEERIQGGFDAIFPFDGSRCVCMADRVVSKLKSSRFL